jgi:hypothetical protein
MHGGQDVACDFFWNRRNSYVAKCSEVTHKCHPKVGVTIDCIPEASDTVLVTLMVYPSPPVIQRPKGKDPALVRATMKPS